AVARAFVGTPSIVIADEPTASPDIDNAAVVTELIVHHGHAAGAATLIATHARMVATTCDREDPLHLDAAGRDGGATAGRWLVSCAPFSPWPPGWPGQPMSPNAGDRSVWCSLLPS